MVEPDKRIIDEAKPPDGRLVRGERSRRKIVESLLALVGEGDMRPSAEAVAARAQVGLRTVFRHFDDMESLYREMGDIMEEKLRPQYAVPFLSSDWRDQLGELARRVASIYEQIMPYKIAGEIRRFESREVLADYRRMVVKHRRSVEGILKRADASMMRHSDALQLVTSFEAWRRLRQDQGLSVTHSMATMLVMTNALIKAAES